MKHNSRGSVLRLCLVALAALVPDTAWSQHAVPTLGDEQVPIFNDLGDHTHPITVSMPVAQQYFDQGLRLCFAFNHDEAIRAFLAAARADGTCAMAHWGVAFALGPNYNLEVDSERQIAACDAIDKATQLAAGGSADERAYIEALAVRYSRAAAADRKQLDRAYADAMCQLAERFPDDLDAATLAAEALMNLRPWDLWTREREPQPGTEQIVAMLERVLEKNPRHPGANHLYIHAVEASSKPERALPCADRLGALMPGAGHLVHMPSHIYFRIGRYGDAVACNQRAVEVDRLYVEKYKPGCVYPKMYYTHNAHFLWSALCVEGRSAEALAAAKNLAALLPEETIREMPMVEYFAPIPLFTLARFARWDEVLAAPKPPDDFSYTTGMWHYVRGLAHLGKGRADEAGAELKRLQEIRAGISAELVLMRHSASELLGIAEGVLAGELEASAKRFDAASDHFREAIRLQDGLQDDEPPPWYFSVRESLGRMLLEAGKPAEAEAIYREDFRRLPENGWSLFGLARALEAQGSAEAGAVKARFETAWSRADVRLPLVAGH